MAGKWAIANTRSSMEPFITFSDAPRPARKGASRCSPSRGDNPGEHDNNPIITEVLKLRVEKARLLGHPTFAHWVTDGQMAKTPGRGHGPAAPGLGPGRRPGARRSGRDAGDRRGEGSNEPIEPWDYRYYAEKVRQAKYDLSDDEVKPYLQLAKLREGMFWAAGELFGLTFARSTTCPSITRTSRCSR